MLNRGFKFGPEEPAVPAPGESSSSANAYNPDPSNPSSSPAQVSKAPFPTESASPKPAPTPPSPPSLTSSDFEELRLAAYTVPSHNFGHMQPEDSSVTCQRWRPPTGFGPDYFIDASVAQEAQHAKEAYENAVALRNRHFMDDLDKDDSISQISMNIRIAIM